VEKKCAEVVDAEQRKRKLVRRKNNNFFILSSLLLYFLSYFNIFLLFLIKSYGFLNFLSNNFEITFSLNFLGVYGYLQLFE
jgi:hypothetical protein